MTITIAPEPFDSADARRLIAALDAHLASRYTPEQRFGPNLSVVGIDVRVVNTKVILSGAISDKHLIPEIVRQVQTVDGVTGVESQIQYLEFARGL